jgi:hypothetical protein
VTAAARHPYQYAVLKAVPRVDRGETINIGIVLYCQALDFLAAAVAVDDDRLRALCPGVDTDGVARAARAVVDAAAEPVGSARESQGQAVRFGVLTAPRSTVVQPSVVHAGLTSDPAATLARLMTRLVHPV